MLKENIQTGEYGFWLDTDDFTVMRGMEYFLQLFEKADLKVVLVQRFKEFPEDCMPVMKFILKPK